MPWGWLTAKRLEGLPRENGVVPPRVLVALRIALCVRRGRLVGFTRGTLWKRLRSSFAEPRELDEGLKLLVERQYLEQVFDNSSRPGPRCDRFYPTAAFAATDPEDLFADCRQPEPPAESSAIFPG